jgi:hypothetical protein
VHFSRDLGFTVYLYSTSNQGFMQYTIDLGTSEVLFLGNFRVSNFSWATHCFFLTETLFATCSLRHSRIRVHALRRASCVSARGNCPERRVAIGSQGSSFANQGSIVVAQCRAALVASVAETLPPYSSLFAAVPISHGGAHSNIVGSAGARVRLSPCRGRTSSHHRFVSSRAVSVRSAVVRAWTVAQPSAQADLPPASQHSAVSFLNHCRTGAHRVAAVRLPIRYAS